MCFKKRFERSLGNKISLDSVKVLNLRRLEHEFSYSMWFDFIAMRFVADTADFPAICHVSDAKDITRNRRETSLRYKQFGKCIVKYNAFKQNFTLFCSAFVLFNFVHIMNFSMENFWQVRCTVCFRKWQSWEWPAAWSCKCALLVWKGPLPVELKITENPKIMHFVQFMHTFYWVLFLG